MKIYGPYKREDGRMHCIIIDNNKRRTVSYPRLLMERHLGRSLLSEEDVHHKDGDVTNNNISNLEIVNHSEHCREHSTKHEENVEVFCVYCDTAFYLTRKQIYTLTANQKRGKHGPFCSKSCSGKYGKTVQTEHLDSDI